MTIHVPFQFSQFSSIYDQLIFHFPQCSALSHQDGRNSAVALLLKKALIQVSDYRLLGASGLAHLAKGNVRFYVKLSTGVQPSWSEGGTTRHNFGRGPSNDYFIKVWFQLSN
jgi:hypothetical protein